MSQATQTSLFPTAKQLPLGLSTRQRAEQLADARLNVSRSVENDLLAKIAETVIVDKRLALNEMLFRPSENKRELHLFYKGEGEDAPYTLHRNALGSFAEKAGIPIKYVNYLLQSVQPEKQAMSLLCDNLNRLFHFCQVDTEKAFLHRTVGKEVRAFLSNRYNTNIASLPTLRAFVDSFRALGAKAVDPTSSSLRYSLKAFLPQVYEAFDGQYLCFGVGWTNSDFGLGSLRIAQTIYDPLGGSSCVLDAEYKRVHLGGVRQGGNIDLDAKALASEIDAVAGAIHSSVTQMLNEDNVASTLAGIRAAQNANVDWRTLKGQLSKFLVTEEVDTIEAFFKTPSVASNLPPLGYGPDGTPVPSKWWAASAVSAIAAASSDEDRRLELQTEAGKLLNAFFKKTEEAE